MEISDLLPKEGEYQRLYCNGCGGYLDLRFIEFHENLSGVDIHIIGLPELFCDNCSIGYLPDKSKSAIAYTHKSAIEHNSTAVRVKQRKMNNNFGFTDVPFVYDSNDYQYIPGLCREFDPGFLTPVFFNRAVLLKYDSSPVYRLRFASTTYGEICQGDDFSISFGLNKNGKIIMWLGDIATLPASEQYYLCSENVESDHSIGSEFYDGQIECIFTEHSKEDRLFEARSTFLDSCFKRFGIKLAHLDASVLEMAIGFNGPIVDTEKERHHVADTLNKIYIESFDNGALGEVLSSLGGNPGNLGSNKRLQAIMKSIASDEDIPGIMSPFFVLYDLRVAYSHLGSIEGGEQRLEYVMERLGLAENAMLQEMYDAIIEQLSASFNRLADIVNNGG